MQFSKATLVVGAAGSGKTTMLIDGVSTRVISGEGLTNLLVFAASRSLAQELRTQILDKIGRTQGSPKIMTMHAWARSVLERFTPESDKVPVMLTAPQQEFRLRELLANFPIENWPQWLRPGVKTKTFTRQLRDKLSELRHRGLDPEDLMAGSELDRSVGRFFSEYLDVLDSEGALDYSELIHRVRLILADGAAQILSGEISAVFVDDFSELDESQIRLLSDLHAAGSQIIAFANPDTSVFGFRGAYPRAISDFGKIFGSDFKRIEVVKNFRSDSKIALAAKSVAAKLPYRGGVRPSDYVVSEKDDSGVVRAITIDNENFIYDEIAGILRQAHAKNGIAWDEMAVIIREGRSEISRLSRAFASAGIPVIARGDELALGQELAVRPLIFSLRLALDLMRGQKLRDEDRFWLLTSPIGSVDTIEARKLLRQEEDFSKQVTPVDELLSQLAKMIEEGQDLSNLLWRIWTHTDWPIQLRSAALRNDEDSQRANRDLDAVIALFDLAERSHLSGEKAVSQFLDELDSQQIAADTTRESDHAREGVSVLTTHRAVGRQWRLVVVTGLQDGQWPRTAPQVKIFDDAMSAAEQVAAERRAFLLSITRASEQLYLVAANGDDGSGAKESRFLYELGVDVERHKAEEVNSLPGMVALLRTAASDRSISEGLRKVAISKLVELKDAKDSFGNPLVEVADPQNWWGILPISGQDRCVFKKGAPIRLSGSDVEVLIKCPRRWLLTRKANANPSNEFSSILGMLIHELAAKADDLDLSGLEKILSETWPKIAPEVEWYSYAQYQKAQLMVQRLKAWIEEDDFELVGTEKRFEVTTHVSGEEVKLVGVVDRLEKDRDNNLRIIDFKTGNSVPSKKEAESHVQLGIYQLAAKLGAFEDIAQSNALADAHLVYLSDKDRSGTLPKVLTQPSLDSRPKLKDQQTESETWVHELLEQAVSIIQRDNFDAVKCDLCRTCVFSVDCPVMSGKESR